MRYQMILKKGGLILCFALISYGHAFGFFGKNNAVENFNCTLSNTTVKTCPGEANGAITLTINGTTCDTFKIKISLISDPSISDSITLAGTNSYTFQDLVSGIYMIEGQGVGMGGASCMCDNFPPTNIEVEEFPSPTFNFIITPNPYFNCETSSVTISADITTYDSYVWKNITTNTIIATGNAPNLQVNFPNAGDYELTTMYNGGCTFSDTITIEDYTNAFPTAATTGPYELTSCTSGVQISAAPSMSGVPNTIIFYHWSGPGITPDNQDSSMLTVSETGIYTLIITDKRSLCKDTIETEVTSSVEFPVADAGDDGLLTCIVSDYQLGGSGTTTIGNINYSWTTFNGILNQTNIQNPTASAVGVYYFEVKDLDTNCSATDSVLVNEDITPPEISIDTTGNIELCDGDNLDLMAISTNADSYEWLTNNQPNGETSTTLNISEMGAYAVIGTNSINGCTASSSTVTLDILTRPSLTIDSTELVIENGETYLINATSNPGMADLFWEIESGNIANIDMVQSQLSLQGTGVPMGNLVLKDERRFGEVIFTIYPQLLDCIGDPVIVKIRVRPEENIFIPDLFTPNGDMVNETWKVIFAEATTAKKYSAIIYSRSGAKVHEMKTLEGDGWNGDGCPDGVYYYIIKNNEGTPDIKGAVTIVRN